MGYAVALSPAAEREWRKLEREARERMTTVVLALEVDPRPPGVAKLTRTNSPIVTWMSWSPIVGQGGTLSFTAGVFHPDPVVRSRQFVWAFLGPAGMIADPADALLTADPRFPRHQQPADADGLSLSPLTDGSMEFQIPIPVIEPGGYAIHGFLYAYSAFTEGTYLDRGSLPFQVT